MAQAYVNKRRLAIIIGVFIVIAVIIAIAVPLSLQSSDDDDNNDGKKMGLDCYPEAEGNPAAVDKPQCSKRGCTFNANPPQGQPPCHYNQHQYGLSLTSVVTTAQGFQATLTQFGQAPFGGDIREWVFTFENRGPDIARFMFDSKAGDRYRVPKTLNLPSSPSPAPKYEVRLTNNQSFAFQIVRKETGTVVWDMDVGPGSLVLSNQFLQLTTRLASTHVYGLGEHVHDSFRHKMTKTWPSFSRDQPPSWDDSANLYGVHPFYTCVEDSQGNTHGVLMLNSNAQEYSFSTLPSLTFRTIGGILDMYVFMGPSPESVVQQYTGAIGRPMMPPYWALGFQLCRYGYNNISNLMNAVESTAMYDIPHDVQYVDIDHMDGRKIFTVDHERFPGLNQYFKSLQDQGMRIIYILDPCLESNATSYFPYEEMKKIGGHIKWAPDVSVPNDSKDSDGSLLGYVWPQGKAVFIDFMKTSVKEKWKELIIRHRQDLTFDGLWIDMNEPASFGTNEERPFNWPVDVKPYWSLHCPENQWEDPPYRPKAAYRWDSSTKQRRLSDKTICMSTVQGDGDKYHHYDVHSLYGWSQTDATLQGAQEATRERSIVISRSTFPGSGQYAGHWLGDNVSQWKDMHSSIIGLLEFNLFGIPYIGADICGFFSDTNPQLCKRWMQLGAFYTFSRNHNTLGAKDQGPGQLGDEVGHASRDIMRVRYQLLPYLYLLFHEAHTQGSTVIRPLHHEFPSDANALSIDKQFLWGACLLISPILEENQTKLDYYLPLGKWYNYFTHVGDELTQGAMRSTAVNSDSMPLLHLRGGCVLVQQEYANNTHFSRQKPLSVVAALDGSDHASGSFFWDDGVSVDTMENGQYYHANLSVASQTLKLAVSHKTSTPTQWDDLHFAHALVMGIDFMVRSVTIQGRRYTDNFNQTGQALEILLPRLPMREDFTVMWSAA